MVAIGSDLNRFLISDDELQKFYERCRSYAEHLIDGNSDGVNPHVLVDAADTKGRSELVIASLMVPFNEHEDKVAAMRGIGRGVYKSQKIPRAWCLISEAWFSLQRMDEPRKYKLPEDDPDRKEVVIVHAMAFDTKRVRHGWRQVRRDDKQQCVAVGSWTELRPNETMESPLLQQVLLGFAEKSAFQEMFRAGARR